MFVVNMLRYLFGVIYDIPRSCKYAVIYFFTKVVHSYVKMEWYTYRAVNIQLNAFFLSRSNQLESGDDGGRWTSVMNPSNCLTPVQSYGLDHIALSVEQVAIVEGVRGGRIKVLLFTIGYCIDTVVDTQVQQVATTQTLRNSKVAAPVVLFYFLFLSTRKGESPCRYILTLRM